ncbi:dimethylarginine dimethylaminohydrolase family protein [[Eubacterium] cellulosolvens]
MNRLFDLAFVRPPSNSYVNCVSTNPRRNEIDLALAKEQHRRYVSALKECGVSVIELAPLEDFPDSVFIQDPALLGSKRTVIGRFGELARRGEEEALLDALCNHRSKIGEVQFVTDPGTLEGGDVLVTDRWIFVGESRRTNSNGIRQLATHLGDLEVRPVKTDLLHLLCGCSYLSDGKMIIAPDLVSPELFPGFEFVSLSVEETYAADALYLGDGKVLIPSGFSNVNKKLKEAGYKGVEVEMSEFHKGDGGVTCLCSPVYKTF